MSLYTFRKINGPALSKCLLYFASMWNLLKKRFLKANVELYFTYPLPK